MRYITNDDIREAYKRGKANNTLLPGQYITYIYDDEKNKSLITEEKHCLIGECLTREELEKVPEYLNYALASTLTHRKIVDFEDPEFALAAQKLFDCGNDKGLRVLLGLD